MMMFVSTCAGSSETEGMAQRFARGAVRGHDLLLVWQYYVPRRRCRRLPQYRLAALLAVIVDICATPAVDVLIIRGDQGPDRCAQPFGQTHGNRLEMFGIV